MPCAKLEPATSKNKEILEINVLQKFTSHALLQDIYFEFLELAGSSLAQTLLNPPKVVWHWLYL